MKAKYIVQPARSRALWTQCSSELDWIKSKKPDHAQSIMDSRRVSLADRPDIDPNCCQRGASVEIDGRPYCASHGGSVALQYLLEGSMTGQPASDDGKD